MVDQFKKDAVARWKAKLFQRYTEQTGAYRDLPEIAAEMLAEGEQRENQLAEVAATVRMGGKDG